MPCDVVARGFRTTEPTRDSSHSTRQIYGSLQATNAYNLCDRSMPEYGHGGLDGIHVPHVDVFSQGQSKVRNEHTLG
jgi:hypothetical protein